MPCITLASRFNSLDTTVSEADIGARAIFLERGNLWKIDHHPCAAKKSSRRTRRLADELLELNRIVKALKAAILITSLALGIANQASADLYQINFNLGAGAVGIGQIDVQPGINGFYANNGFLNVSSGAAAGNWVLYVTGGATTYPGFLTSPAGAYWYNNAYYSSGINPQYPNINAPLDNYGLLFVQNNGNELNIWGNADGSFSLGGNLGGWQNFSAVLAAASPGNPGGASVLGITLVPEPSTPALVLFGGLIFAARAARRFIA